MVALSVSISAKISPFFTASPTFFCHPAITPSVMVSLKRGIKTTSSILLKSILSELAAIRAAAVSTFVFSGTAIVTGASLVFCTEFVFCATKAETSSPAVPIMANKSLTCNLPPRGVPICNKTPC